MFTAFTFGQTSIESSGLFTTGSNANYPYVIAGCFLNDGNSGEEQTLEINITSLPEGATYRVFKTTASGQDYVSNPQPLDLGINNIIVSAISVARTVKFQFSSGAIEFDSLIVNGEVLYDSSNGGGNGDGDCKKVTIAVFKSGKIIITGGQNKGQLETSYRFIKNFIDERKGDFILNDEKV